MKNRRSYYQILHVQPDAPPEVIRSSYRTMMQRLKMHPDLGGDHENAALVNEAYAVLMNSATRAEYDTSLKTIRTSKQAKAPTTSGQKKQDISSTISTQQTINEESCLFCHLQHDFGKTIEPASVCADCGSPLFPVEKQIFEKSDQRSIQRIGKQWQVTFYTHWSHTPHTGQTRDVSLNGMQLLTAEVLTDGQIIKITSSELDAVARVVNHQKIPNGAGGQWRIGLEFLTLRFQRTHGTFVSLDI